MCCRFFICSITGFVTSGWQWPTLIVTTAENASRYFLVLGRMYSSRIFPTWSGVNVSAFFICMELPFCVRFADQGRQDPVRNEGNEETHEPCVVIKAHEERPHGGWV